MDTEKLRPTVTKSAVLTGNKNKNLNQKSGVGKRELRTTEYARGAAFLSFFFFFFFCNTLPITTLHLIQFFHSAVNLYFS